MSSLFKSAFKPFLEKKKRNHFNPTFSSKNIKREKNSSANFLRFYEARHDVNKATVNLFSRHSSKGIFIPHLFRKCFNRP